MGDEDYSMSDASGLHVLARFSQAPRYRASAGIAVNLYGFKGPLLPEEVARLLFKKFDCGKGKYVQSGPRDGFLAHDGTLAATLWPSQDLNLQPTTPASPIPTAVIGANRASSISANRANSDASDDPLA
jgi:hypothetical protein